MISPYSFNQGFMKNVDEHTTVNLLPPSKIEPNSKK